MPTMIFGEAFIEVGVRFFRIQLTNPFQLLQLKEPIKPQQPQPPFSSTELTSTNVILALRLGVGSIGGPDLENGKMLRLFWNPLWELTWPFKWPSCGKFEDDVFFSKGRDMLVKWRVSLILDVDFFRVK